MFYIENVRPKIEPPWSRGGDDWREKIPKRIGHGKVQKESSVREREKERERERERKKRKTLEC